MPSLLSTERKYNQIYHVHVAQVLLLLVMLVFFIIKFILAWLTDINSLGWTIAFLLYCIVFYVYLSYLCEKGEENDNSWGTGYMVEELVGTKLAALGDDYKVIHDISKGKGRENIDHVVVGPTGVFVIESKANRNKMVYYENNQRLISSLGTKFMKQASRNACWIRENISDSLKQGEFVHGVIVRPLNSDRKIEMHCSNRVCVMDGELVYEHIKNFNGELSKENIDNIYHNLCEIKRISDLANRNRLQKKLALFL